MISRSDQDMLHPFRRHQADTCLIPGRRVICSAPANRHAIPEHLPADATCTQGLYAPCRAFKKWTAC